MGHGGYLQIYNGTKYKWVLDHSKTSSIQMDQWNKQFPEHILPNSKVLIYIEFSRSIFTNFSKTIAKAMYRFDEEEFQDAVRAQDENINDPVGRDNNSNSGGDKWVKFKAVAVPDYNLSVIFSDSLNMVKMDEEPSDILHKLKPMPLHGEENDSDYNYYNEDIGWEHNGTVFMYLTQSMLYYDHYQTSLALPRYYKFPTKNWMSFFYEELYNIPLKLLSIPGSHDSGMYTITSRTIGGTSGNTITQRVSIYDQLVYGARYFDLRPTLLKDGKFYMGHYSRYNDTAFGTSGASFLTMIEDINKFTSEIDPQTGLTVNNELIIISVSHDMDAIRRWGDFGGEQWNRLFDLFTANLKFLNATLPERDMADLALSRFLSVPLNQQVQNSLGYVQITQPCVVVLIHSAHPPPSTGLYENHALSIYDRWSDSHIANVMMAKQLDAMIKRSFNQLHDPRNSFLLNWIVTQDINAAIYCAFGFGKGICDILTLSEHVNDVLEFDMLLASLEYEQQWLKACDYFQKEQDKDPKQIQMKIGSNENNLQKETTGDVDGDGDGDVDVDSDDDNNNTNHDDEDKWSSANLPGGLLLSPQPLTFERSLPTVPQILPTIPNIILVDDIDPMMTRLSVVINLFHHNLPKLREIYRRVPKTTDINPVHETDYEFQPFAIPADNMFQKELESEKEIPKSAPLNSNDLSMTQNQQKVEKLLKKLHFEQPEEKIQASYSDTSFEKSIFREKSVLRVLYRDSSDESDNDDDPNNYELDQNGHKVMKKKHDGNIRESSDDDGEDSYVYDEDDEEANAVNEVYTDEHVQSNSNNKIPDGMNPTRKNVRFDQDNIDSSDSDDDIPEPSSVLMLLTQHNTQVDAFNSETIIQCNIQETNTNSLILADDKPTAVGTVDTEKETPGSGDSQSSFVDCQEEIQNGTDADFDFSGGDVRANDQTQQLVSEHNESGQQSEEIIQNLSIPDITTSPNIDDDLMSNWVEISDNFDDEIVDEINSDQIKLEQIKDPNQEQIEENVQKTIEEPIQDDPQEDIGPIEDDMIESSPGTSSATPTQPKNKKLKKKVVQVGKKKAKQE